MADTFLYAQLQAFSLAGAGASIGDSTLLLTSFKTIDGVALAMTDFGTIGFGTIEPNGGAQEEQISFSGLTQNINGTCTLTGVKHVLFLAPYTQTANLTKSHIGGAKFVISNTSAFYDKLASKANDEDITGDWHVPTPAVNASIANKKYVDDTASFGAPLMITSVAGIAQEATAAQINAGTQVGNTGAEFAVNPKYLKDSEYYTLRPTSAQKDALAGTGTPNGTTGLYVTLDTLVAASYEVQSNKSTTTTLGGSNTLYPSQNAVKTYVDSHGSKLSVGYPNHGASQSGATMNDTYTVYTIPANTLGTNNAVRVKVWTYIQGNQYTSISQSVLIGGTGIGWSPSTQSYGMGYYSEYTLTIIANGATNSQYIAGNAVGFNGTTYTVQIESNQGSAVAIDSTQPIAITVVSGATYNPGYSSGSCAVYGYTVEVIR